MANFVDINDDISNDIVNPQHFADDFIYLKDKTDVLTNNVSGAQTDISSLQTQVTDLINGGPIIKSGIQKTYHILERQQCENDPFVWNGKLYYFLSYHVWGSPRTGGILKIIDFETKQVISTFGSGCYFGSLFVDGSTVRVIAANSAFKNNKFVMYTSTDLTTWSSPVDIYDMGASGNYQALNSSVCKNTNTGEYMIAFECYTSGMVPYIVHKKTANWSTFTTVGPSYGDVGSPFTSYVGCPSIFWYNGSYYETVLFLENGVYLTRVCKFTDLSLSNWTISLMPFLAPDSCEGKNASDVSIAEYNECCYILYMDGDQSTWGNLKYAIYKGTLGELLTNYV